MASLVNLDALIPREDFEVVGNAANLTSIHRISLKELEEGFLYNALRKPDFQRETSDWSSAKVLDLIRTFVDGELVPAVILWESGGKVFVIDGAHRLSALLSWIHNDYGDGSRSRAFFENRLPPEQTKVADRTRKLIHGEIGAYSEYIAAARNVGTSDQKIESRLSRLGFIAIPVQWIPAITPKQAEDSFFKINQTATPIDATELRILKARTSANALAARAIMRSGTGHRYWSKFPKETQTSIEKIGRDIYTALYDPPLEVPIKTLDIPVAGKGYGTLPFIFDLVNLSNEIKIADSTRKRSTKDELEKDEDGLQTLAFLRSVQRRVIKITGTAPATIGPHPAVYFYTLGGTFQPAAFLATVELFHVLEEKNQLIAFTKVRSQFEDFILANKIFLTQIVHRLGSGARSRARILQLFLVVISGFWSRDDAIKIAHNLSEDADFSFLSTSDLGDKEDGDNRSFSRALKTAAYLRDALEGALRCSICGARMHKNSIQVDHIHRKQDGGDNSLQNANLSHPFCNSTVKN